MKQRFTSARTSIRSGKIPKVYNLFTPAPHALIFDYGAGRFSDRVRDALPHGVVYAPYDPFNIPDDVNARSLYYIRCAMRARLPITVVCSNVLNVIDSMEQIEDMAKTIRQIVTVTGGIGYVTVYEGDRSGNGRQTGPDQWQRNEPIANYARFFPRSEIKRGMITVYPEV